MENYKETEKLYTDNWKWIEEVRRLQNQIREEMARGRLGGPPERSEDKGLQDEV